MRNLGKPHFTYFFITVPQTLLALYVAAGYIQNFSIKLLLMLIACITANVAFSAYAFSKRREETLASSIYISAAAVFFLMSMAGVFLLSDSAFINNFLSARLAAILLCSISILFALLALTNKDFTDDIARYIVCIVAVPLIWFLAFNLLTGIKLDTAVIILIIAGVFLMLFLLIKIMALYKKKKEKLLGEEKPPAKLIPLYAIFSLALPLFGLLVNLGTNIVGDFSDPLFFIIPIINGILLLLPSPVDKRLRLLKFFIHAAAATYLLYFFIVFLPFMPYGILLSIVIVGAFLLSPAAALTMQIIHFVKEWPVLSKNWGTKRVLAVFMAGLAVLPVLVITSYTGDRENLNAAATYIDQDLDGPHQNIDLYRLKRSLKNIKCFFEPDAGSFRSDIFTIPVSGNTPLLSDFYSTLVLDKKVVSEENIAQLEQLFFDSYPEEFDRDTDEALPVPPGEETQLVKLFDISSETSYDETIGVWRTWIHLSLQAPSDSGKQEYITQISLPEGVYVSDYYLEVNGERKKGILADSRAAFMVYQDIVSTQRDPGLLRYAENNMLELRVFPFEYGVPRYAGFEVIHSQNTSLEVDGRTVKLSAATTPDEVKADGAVLISPGLKEKLPLYKKRGLQYCFIVDCSNNSDIRYQISLIEEYAKENAITSGKVIFASYNLQEYDFSELRKANIIPQCGFNLGLAIKRFLREAGENVPVILFTSENPAEALMPKNITVLSKKYPESCFYYHLMPDLKLTPYSFETNLRTDSVAAPIINKARDYKGIPVRDDSQSEILQTGESPAVYTASGNRFLDALKLDLFLKNNPSLNKQQSLDMLRASFRAKILTPQTSFIVVETFDQEKALYDAQENIIEDKKLIARETLDEPPILLCIFFALVCTVILTCFRRHKKKRLSC